jgi:UPF0271 protein
VRIDLNADVGEGNDELPIFPHVTSVSIACGAHAGDEQTMDRCVAEAQRLGVSIGAHPGYPDRDGFGRVAMTMTSDGLIGSIVDQVRALAAVCARRGASLSHVKPHGALSNLAATDDALAATVVEAVKSAGEGLALVALAGSAMIEIARAGGVRVAAEAFADRAYTAAGTLAQRGTPGALVEDPEVVARRALAIARGEGIVSADGTHLRLGADTICLHSDTPGALEIARTVRKTLEEAGVEVAPFMAR